MSLVNRKLGRANREIKERPEDLHRQAVYVDPHGSVQWDGDKILSH